MPATCWWFVVWYMYDEKSRRKDLGMSINCAKTRQYAKDLDMSINWAKTRRYAKDLGMSLKGANTRRYANLF